MYQKRTDLALEQQESFEEDEAEIAGVAIDKKNYPEDGVDVATVDIMNASGAKKMQKPVGTYITLEYQWKTKKETIARYLVQIFEKLVQKLEQQDKKTYRRFLILGLGNRQATPDALGPSVLDEIEMNRPVFEKAQKEKRRICGIAPGVMGQTGMESREIIEGIIAKVHPDALLVVDALASRSIRRLCSTVQITDVGICPGSGIGNNRDEISRETVKVPVIAIGVPTVVDAGTIVYESLEHSLQKEGYSDRDIQHFFQRIEGKILQDFFVTPKEIDEKVRIAAETISKAVNDFICSEAK